ncbi:MAG: hypothetical protein ACJARS_003853, partial [bacterium]
CASCYLDVLAVTHTAEQSVVAEGGLWTGVALRRLCWNGAGERYAALCNGIAFRCPTSGSAVAVSC